MIHFTCDRCKKVISPFVYRISPEKFSNADYSMSTPITTTDDILFEKLRSLQLCRDCLEQIAAYTMNYNVDINSEGGGYSPHTAASRFRSQIRSLNRQKMTAAS